MDIKKIIREEIENEKTRIPQVNSNPLLRNKLTYWKRKQTEERKRKKVSKKNHESLEKEREKQARKIKAYLYGILEDAWRYSNDRRPGRRKNQSK